MTITWRHESLLVGARTSSLLKWSMGISHMSPFPSGGWWHCVMADGWYRNLLEVHHKLQWPYYDPEGAAFSCFYSLCARGKHSLAWKTVRVPQFLPLCPHFFLHKVTLLFAIPSPTAWVVCMTFQFVPWLLSLLFEEKHLIRHSAKLSHMTWLILMTVLFKMHLQIFKSC